MQEKIRLAPFIAKISKQAKIQPKKMLLKNGWIIKPPNKLRMRTECPFSILVTKNELRKYFSL